MQSLNEPLYKQPQSQLDPSLGALSGYSNDPQNTDQQPPYGKNQIRQRVSEDVFDQERGTKMSLIAEKQFEKKTLEQSLLKGGFRIYVIWLILETLFLISLTFRFAQEPMWLFVKICLCSPLFLIMIQSIVMVLGIKARSKSTIPPGEDSNLGAVGIVFCGFWCLVSLIINISANVFVGWFVKKKIQKVDNLTVEIKNLETQVK